MSQFIYFVPSATVALTPAKLDEIGLGHMHDKLQPEGVIGKGPEGQSGLLAGYQLSAVQGARRAPRYKPDEQTWAPGPLSGEKPAWWVGYWNDSRPTAAELQRKRFIGGHQVPMIGGEPWTVPIARSTHRASSLPKLMQLGADGRTWVMAELPEFEELCRHAERAFDYLLQVHQGIDGDDPNRVTLDWQDAMAVVAAALTVNYRVSAVELSVLRLIGDVHVWTVLEALCDWPNLMKVLKERAGNAEAPETLPTDSGSGAS